MKNKRCLGLILCLVLMLLCCSACSSDTDVEANGGIVTYNHEYSGLSVQLPDDWKLQKEDNNHAIFVSSDNTLSFGLLFEPGSYAYYSAADIAKQLGKIITGVDDKNYKCEIIEELDFSKVIGNNAVKVLARGIDGSDTNFVIDFVECSPFPGIRYYMFTATDVATYEENLNLIDTVYESFNLSKTEAEIYQLLESKKK